MFTVYGRPQPQGSTRAFMPRGATFPVLTSDNAKLKPWRQEVAGAALHAVCLARRNAGGRDRVVLFPRGLPVRVTIGFYLQKPKSARQRDFLPTKKPDLDKLARGVLDALTGIAFEDDSQVTQLVCGKNFDVPERAEIAVQQIVDGRADV